MNGMNGIECARLIRGLKLEFEPYLVGLTGFQDCNIEQQFMHAGVNLFIVKPLLKSHLKRILVNLAEWYYYQLLFNYN